jgi:hypothetical protein
MGRQGAKMCKYGTDYILHEACSLPHIEVCRYTCTRHSVVTTTYKTDFVTYRGLSRHGGGGGQQQHTSHTLVQRFEMLPNVSSQLDIPD